MVGAGVVSTVFIATYSTLIRVLLTDGMFAILIPTSLSPLIVTLFWAERKAKKLGLAPDTTEFKGETLTKRVWQIGRAHV